MTSAADRHRTAAARRALWDGLRLVAIDVETCKPPGKPPRLLAVAAVTCRFGQQVGTWSTFVNPQVPIDADTFDVHGITDDMVAKAPTLDVVASQLLDVLTPADADERVLLAGHNVGFDVGALHADLGRIERELPELVTFDTYAKDLLDLLEVRYPSRGLPAVADVLGVDLADHHDALADARACADIAVVLLDRAADAGHRDLDQLLADGNTGKPTTDIKAASKKGSARRHRRPPTRRVTPAHEATHTALLPADPTDEQLQQWTDHVTGCGTQRCHRLADRIASARAADAELYKAVLAALDRTLAPVFDADEHGGEDGGEDGEEVDAPAVATVLGGLLGLLEHMPPKSKGNQGLRNAAFDWAHHYGPKLDELHRCGDDRCPDCQAGRPCPLDVWRQALAPVVVGDTRDRAKGVLWPNSSKKGTGTYTTWVERGWDRQLADEALAEVVRRWREEDNPGWMSTVAHDGFAAGCRHPDIVRLVADSHADPGTPENLQAAVDTIDTVLAADDGSTHPPWRQLAQHRRLLAGQLRRSRGIDTGTIDGDGNPVYAPRHHPTDPKRPPHPDRFTL